MNIILWMLVLLVTSVCSEDLNKLQHLPCGDISNNHAGVDCIDYNFLEEVSENHTKRAANIVHYRILKWLPAGDGLVYIPYTATALTDPDAQRQLRRAIQQFERSTCIKFVNHTDEPDFLEFGHFAKGCSSNIGRREGGQTISLQTEMCWRAPGIIMHEIMHALGYIHEHMRHDAEVTLGEVQSRFLTQFNRINPEFTDLSLPYDYKSLMHYPRTAGGVYIKECHNDSSGSEVTEACKGLFEVATYHPWIDGLFRMPRNIFGFSSLDVEKVNMDMGCSTTAQLAENSSPPLQELPLVLKNIDADDLYNKTKLVLNGWLQAHQVETFKDLQAKYRNNIHTDPKPMTYTGLSETMACFNDTNLDYFFRAEYRTKWDNNHLHSSKRMQPCDVFRTEFYVGLRPNPIGGMDTLCSTFVPPKRLLVNKGECMAKCNGIDVPYSQVASWDQCTGIGLINLNSLIKNDTQAYHLDDMAEMFRPEDYQYQSLHGNPFASLGAGGGMPSLAAMLNNPQLMNMATQMMTDPNMQQFMGQMMSGMMGGGGPPPGTGATSGGSTEAPSTGGSGGSSGGTGTNPQGFTQLLEVLVLVD